MPTLKRKCTIAIAFVLFVSVAQIHADGRAFTLADDIGLSIFGKYYGSGDDGLVFSHDRKFFAITTYRGRLEINRSESTLRVYRTEEVRRYLLHHDAFDQPSPVWTLTKATYIEGPIITDIHWTNSDDFAFLCRNAEGVNQLFLANLAKKAIEPLTPAGQEVKSYDIRSRNSFVYTVLSQTLHKNFVKEAHLAAFVGTGRKMEDLVYPDPKESEALVDQDLSELWVYSDGRRIRIADNSGSRALPIHTAGQQALSLSPDGRSVVTALSVPEVPSEWETLYLPELPTSPYRIQKGKQDIYAAAYGAEGVAEYVVIDVQSGKMHSLTEAPIGTAANWWSSIETHWSDDGRFVLLSNTFVKPTDGTVRQTSRPCVAVADLRQDKIVCVQYFSDVRDRITQHTEFTQTGRDCVIVHYLMEPALKPSTAVYTRRNDGTWVLDTSSAPTGADDPSMKVSVRQDMNHAPVLVATSGGTSREILDPNPQLHDVKLTQITRFDWTDKSGRDRRAGLYKPLAYEPGRRYPLIIQTHGFFEGQFRPSGIHPTAFAAQELASAGFVVLQVHDCPFSATLEEASCNVDAYESAVQLLAKQGLVDPQRVGIIGFSRTCFYVLQALTTSTLHFAAASITDGVNFGYLQYLLSVDTGYEYESNGTIGAAPTGEGLQQWLKRSPEFNMDRVTTPLLVAAPRKQILYNWEPYAALRYLHKPVDLLVLNTTEHVLTSPRVREASQGTNIDWFRFWLQGYEDPNPKKQMEYERWRHLRELHDSHLDSSAQPGSN